MEKNVFCFPYEVKISRILKIRFFLVRHTAPETEKYRKLMSAPVLFAYSQDLIPITLCESIKIFHPAHFEKMRFYARIMGILPYKSNFLYTNQIYYFIQN